MQNFLMIVMVHIEHATTSWIIKRKVKKTIYGNDAKKCLGKKFWLSCIITLKTLKIPK